MSNPWKPGIIQILVIVAVTVGGHVVTVVVDDMLGEEAPLWIQLTVIVVCVVIAYGGTVLHGHQVAKQVRGNGPGNWLDRIDAEDMIEGSTMYARRLESERVPLIAREIRGSDDLPDGERRILASKITARHRREEVAVIRLRYTEECSEGGYDPDQDLYHEDTLEAWLLERARPKPEPEFDPFAFLPDGDDQ
ncbi:MAG: hypothetical protein F4107_12970 [Gemmatimonadetes bacterium]|nr:hypothetical protein [Gemmatimonadota bacterium]MYD14345.1 hypothetical protein [Gemmatimonadota bacterium]MYI66826.1 hypothetical protein [Gemmatimonadota bacterium]